jgi:catalase
MSNDLKGPAAGEPQRSSTGSPLARFVLIGIALMVVVGAFAYAGGWFTPKELTPARFVDGFEQVDGKHPGFRRNHARGVGVSGFFESNGNGVRLSKAGVFRPGLVPVIGRFSLGGGHPEAADSPKAVRGLGLQFSLPDGELWRTAMVNLPVFPFRTPEAFYEQMLASKPDPTTGAPDPAKMDAFVANHPEFVKALDVVKKQGSSAGFADSRFHGLHAFRFTNAAGEATPVRWLLTPMQTSPVPEPGDKYLFETLIGQIHRQPLRWRLMVVVGQPGDPTNDATSAWPDEREQIEVGTVTLDRVESDDTSAASGLNFDPLVLPAGITPSDDPLLSARSAVYSQAFTRRAGETKQPSPITPADVQKGN